MSEDEKKTLSVSVSLDEYARLRRLRPDGLTIAGHWMALMRAGAALTSADPALAARLSVEWYSAAGSVTSKPAATVAEEKKPEAASEAVVRARKLFGA